MKCLGLAAAVLCLGPGYGAPKPGAADPSAAQSFEQRRAPGGAVPTERYLQAQEPIRQMRAYSIAQGRFLTQEQASAPGANLPNWTLLGPTNIGGRTRAIVVDPNAANTIYAGAATGGVWKSVDGGSHWTSLTDSVPLAFVNALAIDPGNSQVLYAGTGESYTSTSSDNTSSRGLGILKTTNGGTSWTRLPSTANSNFYYVNKVQVSHRNSQHIFAATGTGVWASTDGGNTWNNTLPASSSLSRCDDVELRSDQAADIAFAACEVGVYPTFTGTIWRNPDAGGSGAWTQVRSEPRTERIALAIAPSSPSTIYAVTSIPDTTTTSYQHGLGEVLRSIAGGDSGTWTTQDSNQSSVVLNTMLLSYPDQACNNSDPGSIFGQGEYDLNIAVDPINPNRVWVQGIDLFRSDDGGVNWGIAAFWSKLSKGPNIHADEHALAFAPGYGSSNQTLYVGSDGGIARSDNSLAATATGSGALCQSTNPGITWTDLSSTYATTEFYDGDVYPAGGSYMGGTQDNGTLRGDTAEGTSWQQIFGGDGGRVVVDPIVPSTIYTESLFGLTLSRSDDGGITGVGVTNGITSDFGFNTVLPNAVTLDPNDTRRVYTGGLSLWRSTDRGDTWTVASGPIVTNTTDGITAIAIAPSNSNQVLFGTLTGAIYRSSAATVATGPAPWAYSSPRAGAISSIAFDLTNANVAYVAYSTFDQVAGDNHLYKTTDGGITWTGLDGSGTTGLPDLPATSIVVDPQQGSTIYVGTDMGVFVSLDGGASWAHDVSSIGDTIISRLRLDRGTGVAKLFAFTYGRGVWEVTVPNSGTPCSYSVSPTSQVSGPGSTPQYISVTTQPGCVWSATVTNFAVQLLPPAGGVGSGRLYYQFFPDPFSYGFGGGIVSIQGQQIPITLNAAIPVTGNDEPAVASQMGLIPSTAGGVSASWTSNPNDPVHSCTGSRDSLTGWFVFTASSTGRLDASLVAARSDGPFGDAGMVLTVYPDTGGQPGTELGCAKNARTSGANLTTIDVRFNASAGSTYLIEVSANGASPGGSALLSVAPAAPAPGITVTPSPTSVTAGASVQFTASAANLISGAVRWSVTPLGYGSISPTGLFTALASTDTALTATVTAISAVDNTTQASSIVTINPGPVTILTSGIDNSASYLGPGVSPGEIITIFGTTVGPSTLASATISNHLLSTTAGDTQVLFDGRPAPMLYAYAGQVSAVVPYEVAGQSTTKVQVTHKGQPSPSVTVPVVASAPGLYTYYSSGDGPAAIVNQDQVINTPQLAAVPGTVIILFATGEGQTNPPGVSGQINDSGTYPAPQQNVSLSIGGIDAHLNYAGAAPYFVAGAMQINAVIPPNVTPGPNVPVQLKIGDGVSQPNVTVAVLGQDSRQGLVYYQNTGSTPVQVTLYTTQASPTPAIRASMPSGFSSASPVDLENTYGNTAGIQAGNGLVRVLSQVCTYEVSNITYWLCKGSAQQPFGN